MFSIKMTNGKEINALLKKLPDKVSKQIVTKSLRRSAKPIQIEAKSRLKTATQSSIKRTIKLRVAKTRSRSLKGISVIASHPVAHLIDEGTIDRYTGTKGIYKRTKDSGSRKERVGKESTGHARAFRGRLGPNTPGYAFLIGAAESKSESAVSIFEKECFSEIEKAFANGV